MGRKRNYSRAPATEILLPDPFARRKFIVPNGPFVLTPGIESAERILAREAQLARTPDAFEYFGIDPKDKDAWQELALALLERHWSGFSVRRKRGAPRKVGLGAYCKLYRWAINKQANRTVKRKRSPSAICRDLAKDPKFRRAVPQLAKAGKRRLETLLSEARTHRRARVAHILQQRRQQEGSDIIGDAPPWFPAQNPFKKTVTEMV